MSASKPPFWTTPTATKPQRLRGTHEQLLAAAEDGARVLPYDRGRSHAVGELVLHGVFGLGIVVELVAKGKVTVRFEAGDRLLVAGG